MTEWACGAAADLAAGIDADLDWCQDAPHGEVIDVCEPEFGYPSLEFLRDILIGAR